MTFAENINRICKARGVTLTAFIKSLGMSTSKVTAIEQGIITSTTKERLEELESEKNHIEGQIAKEEMKNRS